MLDPVVRLKVDEFGFDYRRLSIYHGIEGIILFCVKLIKPDDICKRYCGLLGLWGYVGYNMPNVEAETCQTWKRVKKYFGIWLKLSIFVKNNIYGYRRI